MASDFGNFPEKVRFEHKKRPRPDVGDGVQTGARGGLAVVGTGGLDGGRLETTKVPFFARRGGFLLYF